MSDLLAIGLLFGGVFVYFLGTLLTQYVAQAYNVYKIYLRFWGVRIKMPPDTVTDAWDCLNSRSPYSQSDNLVIIVLFWPLALFYIACMIPVRLVLAIWERYVTNWYTLVKRKEYRLLPSWVSWSKLTEILNRTI